MTKLLDRTGERQVNKQGLEMLIIKYRNAGSIDIQFSDGTVVLNKTYQNFKHGRINHPSHKINFKDRTDEVGVARNGMKIKIIAYRRAGDIDIQFEDGTLANHKSYDNFVSGNVVYKHFITFKDRTGEVNYNTQNEKMTILEYRCAEDIDVIFEDGTIVKNKCYDSFNKGKIYNPNSPYRFRQYNRAGETAVSSTGMQMTIISYRAYKDIDVQFEDGTIVKNTDYDGFKHGYIKYKSKQFSKVRHAFTCKGVKYMYCECKICNNTHILKVEEMKDFQCPNIK